MKQAPTQKDNSTFTLKRGLRLAALKELGQPAVVLETNGGFGKLFSHCYRDVVAGAVFENDPEKSAALAQQRPTWSVYEADCVAAIGAGVASHLEVNFLDCDPYGECWPIIDAFFRSTRPRSERLVVVVNDGLRQSLMMNGGWHCDSMREMVSRYGNSALHKNYLQVCRDLLEEKSAPLGYELKRWSGYHCGANNCMTHFAAVLQRSIERSSS
jgi:hypothetical protein